MSKYSTSRSGSKVVASNRYHSSTTIGDVIKQEMDLLADSLPTSFEPSRLRVGVQPEPGRELIRGVTLAPNFHVMSSTLPKSNSTLNTTSILLHSQSML